MSIKSELPSNHLILCRPLLFLPSVFPSVQLFLLRARSPAGGPSALARGCTWTFVNLWAPWQCVGHHQCLLPSACSRRRHRLAEVKLMAWGCAAVSGESQCCNGNLPAPKTVLFPALGKFPQRRAACRSFSYAASPGGSHTDGSALSVLADGKHAIVCRDLHRAVKTVGSTTDPRHPQTSHAALAVLPRRPQEMCKF